EKARQLAADMIVLDLEDAVKEADKASAREAAVEAVREGFGGRPAAIRINGEHNPHHGADMLAVRRSGARFVVLPKVETARELNDARVVCERPVIAMIETAGGVINAAQIARGAAGVIAGTNDLAAALHIPADNARRGLATSLQQIVLAARAAGIAAFDGVHNRLDDEESLSDEAREGRAFGFDGKSVIHPNQIAAVNRIFSPSADELATADALVAAATGGAERHDGRMIEGMHVAQARALIAKARR
ncbi:MAG TPA: CoA ester lyase, partial [Allosphingosinicella sp.]